MIYRGVRSWHELNDNSDKSAGSVNIDISGIEDQLKRLNKSLKEQNLQTLTVFSEKIDSINLNLQLINNALSENNYLKKQELYLMKERLKMEELNSIMFESLDAEDAIKQIRFITKKYS